MPPIRSFTDKKNQLLDKNEFSLSDLHFSHQILANQDKSIDNDYFDDSFKINSKNINSSHRATTQPTWRYASRSSSTGSSRVTSGEPSIEDMRSYLDQQLDLARYQGDAVVQGVFRDLTDNAVRGLYVMMVAGQINQADVVDCFRTAGRECNRYLALAFELHRRGGDLVRVGRFFNRNADGFRSLDIEVRVGAHYELMHYLILVDNLDPSRYRISTNVVAHAGASTRAERDLIVGDRENSRLTVLEIKRRSYFEINDENRDELADQIRRLVEGLGHGDPDGSTNQIEYVVDASNVDPTSVQELVKIIADYGVPYRVRVHTHQGVSIYHGHDFQPYDVADPDFRVSENGRPFHRTREIPPVPRRDISRTPSVDGDIDRIIRAREFPDRFPDVIDQTTLDGLVHFENLISFGSESDQAGATVDDVFSNNNLSNHQGREILERFDHLAQTHLDEIINHLELHDPDGDALTEVRETQRILRERGQSLRAELPESGQLSRRNFDVILRLVRNLNQVTSVFVGFYYQGYNSLRRGMMSDLEAIHALIEEYEGYLRDNDTARFERYELLRERAAHLPEIHPQNFLVGSLPPTLREQLGLVVPDNRNDILRMLREIRTGDSIIVSPHDIPRRVSRLSDAQARQMLTEAIDYTSNNMTISRLVEITRRRGGAPLLDEVFFEDYQVVQDRYNHLINEMRRQMYHHGPEGHLDLNRGYLLGVIQAAGDPDALVMVGIVDQFTTQPITTIHEALSYLMFNYLRDLPPHLQSSAQAAMIQAVEVRLESYFDHNHTSERTRNTLRASLAMAATHMRERVTDILTTPRVSVGRFDFFDRIDEFDRLHELSSLLENMEQTFRVYDTALRTARNGRGIRRIESRLRTQLRQHILQTFTLLNQHFEGNNLPDVAFVTVLNILRRRLNIDSNHLRIVDEVFNEVRNREFFEGFDGRFVFRRAQPGGRSRMVFGPGSLVAVAIHDVLDRYGYVEKFEGVIKDGVGRVRSGLARSWESGALSRVRANLEQDSAHLRRSTEAIVDGVLEGRRDRISRADAEYVVRYLSNPPNNPADNRVDVKVGDKVYPQVTMLEVVLLKQQAETMGIGDDGFKIIGPEERITKILEKCPKLMDDYQRVCGEVLEGRKLFLTSPMGATLWCTSLQALSFAMQGDLDKAMSAILVRDGIIGGLCDVTSRSGITRLLNQLEKCLERRLPCARTEKTLLKLRGMRMQMINQLPNAISVAVMQLISMGKLSAYHLATAGTNIVLSQVLSNVVMQVLGKVSVVFRSSGVGMLIGGIIDVMLYPAMDKLSRMTESFIERKWNDEKTEKVLLSFRQGVDDPIYEKRFKSIFRKYDDLKIAEGDLEKRMSQWQQEVSEVGKMVEGFDIHQRSLVRKGRIFDEMRERGEELTLSETDDGSYHRQVMQIESQNWPKTVSGLLKGDKYDRLKKEVALLKRIDPYLGWKMEEQIALTQMQLVQRAKLIYDKGDKKAKQLSDMILAMSINGLQRKFEELRKEFIEEIVDGLSESEKKSLMVYVLYQQKPGDTHYDYLVGLSWQELRRREAWLAKQNEIDVSFLSEMTGTERAVIFHLLSHWPQPEEKPKEEQMEPEVLQLFGKLADNLVDEWG